MAILTRLDWLGALAFEDLTTLASRLPADKLPVSVDSLMVGMPMRTADGRVLVGYPAVRRALLRTPLGFFPALLMYVPGISHIGVRVYKMIVASRRRDGVCEVPVRR